MLLVSAGTIWSSAAAPCTWSARPGPLSSSVNPHSCLFTGTQQFTWGVTGGGGQFDDATGSFTGTVSAVALLARNPDGSCWFTQFPRYEVDKFAESGTLSF